MTGKVKSLGRRKFLTKASKAICLSALSTTLGSELRGQTVAAPTNLRLGTNKSLLQESDFHYLGHYVLNYGGEFSLGEGLAHRYVDNQLRFLVLKHMPSGGEMSFELREFAAPPLNGTAGSFTNGWQDIWNGLRGGGQGKFHGLWWDDQTQKLWSTAAIDYPNDSQMNNPLAIAVTTLEDNGTVGEVRGLFGMEEVGARQIYGGFVRIPGWFQNQYKVGPYGVGFGGYASRMAQGLGASMGPVLIAIPDPTLFGSNYAMPTSQYKVLMNHFKGTKTGPWYPGNSQPTNSDRGVRTPDVINEYDNWTSPAPDGLGRWTWGDSPYQTGLWIDLPDKHGFVLIPTVHTGRTWYENSTLNFEGKTAEFQIFDPARFGEVISGKREVWDVKPRYIWRPPEFIDSGRGAGNGPGGTACAASFDVKTNRLYVRWSQYEGKWPNNKDRILVWEIG